MSDTVNHPSHYTGFSNGAEVIDITENLSFNLGNVVKYVARAGRKTADPVEDLRKAKFYLERELNRVSGLPDGLTKTAGVIFRDQAEDAWRWTFSPDEGWHWEYLDDIDNRWIPIFGNPSKDYAPFKETHV